MVEWVSALIAAINASGLIVPILGGLFLVAAAVLGTRAAARINAEAAVAIAGINADAATKVEHMKADSQRDLERDRDYRQWRRERVKPLIEKLDQLRKRDLTVVASQLLDSSRKKELDDVVVLLREGFIIHSELATVAPPELQAAVASRVRDEDRWTGLYSQWLQDPPDTRQPFLKSPWYQDLQRQEEVKWQLQVSIDDYVYSGPGPRVFHSIGAPPLDLDELTRSAPPAR